MVHMIVGIDYTAAAWQGAGIGRCTRELVRAAAAQGGPWRYVLFYAARGLPPGSPYVADLRQLCAAHPHVRAVPIALTPRLLTILWQRLRLPLYAELFTGRLDLLHAPDFAIPPTRARTLVTVHDLTFLVRPECFEPALQRYLTRTVPRSVARASLVIADSRATQADLTRYLAVPPERTAVVHLGVGPAFRPLPPDEAAAVGRRLGLPRHFLLFVGTLEPRKNLPRLIEACALLHRDWQGDQADLHAIIPQLSLVIAGRKGWLYDEIFATVERLQLGDRVHFLDYVTDADLPALYNLARVFVYPSLYEGFGMPVVEAMACGTPVVTSTLSSLPEVVGTAAVLVDPLDPRAIAAGITQALAGAGRLRAAGPAQARQFSWEQAARSLLACYEQVAYERIGSQRENV